MFTGFRLAVRRFFKRNRKLIVVVLIVWIIIIIVNNYLRNVSYEEFDRTTYDKHTSLLNDTQTVPDKISEKIDTTIATYIDYCNDKNYEMAYSMISEDCKRVYFDTIDEFKKYVDTIFNEEKVYYLQNFSNYNGYYVYRIRILEDMMSTGLTGKDEIYFYEEKIVLTEKENGEIALSVRQFVATEDINEIYEDDYIKMWIESKDVFYEKETYTIKVKNKTQKTVVLADKNELNELQIKVGIEARVSSENNLRIVLMPEETNTYTREFVKFADEESRTSGIIFNNVRVLPQYSGIKYFHQDEIDNAEALYSIQIPF